MNKCVCYIPLDNRPIVYKRIMLLAKSCAIDLLIPDEDIIKTTLDYQPRSSTNLNHGDITRLYDWFKNLDHSKIDGYVMCSDQFIFGGLVNSRISLTPDYVNAKEIINKFLCLSLIGNKPLIIIDSLMRLASTASYNFYNLTEYNSIRNYGIHDRVVLDFSNNLSDEENIQNIFNNYEVAQDYSQIDYESFGLTKDMVDRYKMNRLNKLQINNYLVEYAINHDNCFLLLGIDDSNPKVTIQTNEINFLKKKIKNGIIFVGIDELPLMAFTKMIMKFNDVNPAIDINYYGNREMFPGDPYDVGTLEECVDIHLLSMGIKKDKKSDLKALVLSYNEETNQQDIKNIINDCYKYISNGNKVILIEGSGFSHLGPLQKELAKCDLLTKLISYSNWNTVANVIGITLSIGCSRYCYLKKNVETKQAKEGYLELLLFSYIKDISYKQEGQKIIKKIVNERYKNDETYLNFYNVKEMKEEEVKKIVFETIEILNSKVDFNINVFKEMFRKANLINDFELYNYRFPWYRMFEMDFDVIVK